MADKAAKKNLDFTNVKERGDFFTKKRLPEGDYRGKILSVEDKNSKNDNPMWVFTIGVDNHTYPYYCILDEANLWKVRSIFAAAGLVIPKKRVAVDPNKIVGKAVGVTLQDTEYNGKAQSEITFIIPLSEVANADDDDIEDDEEDEEELPPPPKKKAVAKKRRPEPEPEEDEDEEEEEEVIDDDDDEEELPPPPKKKAKKSAPAPVKRPTNKRRPQDVDDDELEELDISDL